MTDQQNESQKDFMDEMDWHILTALELKKEGDYIQAAEQYCIAGDIIFETMVPTLETVLPRKSPPEKRKGPPPERFQNKLITYCEKKFEENPDACGPYLLLATLFLSRDDYGTSIGYSEKGIVLYTRKLDQQKHEGSPISGENGIL